MEGPVWYYWVRTANQIPCRPEESMIRSRDLFGGSAAVRVLAALTVLVVAGVLPTSLMAQAPPPEMTYSVYVGAESADLIHIVEFGPAGTSVVKTSVVGELSLETEGQRLFELNGGFGKGDKRIHVSPSTRIQSPVGWRPLIAWSISVGSGCNFAIRRNVAVDLGGFDEALDMGAALPGGGDLDMLWRVLEAGFDIVYEPTVQAWHEHRRETSETIDQIIGHNMSLIAMLTKALTKASGQQRVPIFVFLVWRLIKPGIRLLRRAVGKDPLPARALMSLWRHCWCGLFAYPAARRLAQSRKELESQ